jgi:hypothetical protein
MLAVALVPPAAVLPLAAHFRLDFRQVMANFSFTEAGSGEEQVGAPRHQRHS